jgi:hypothetical protein
LIAYFAHNAQNADGRNVVYADFPVDHVWKIQENVLLAQQRREQIVGRMYFVHPTNSERFFLCLLHIVVSSTTSFEHLQIVDDIEHLMFQATYRTLGFLQNDAEWDTCTWETCIDQDIKKVKEYFCDSFIVAILWIRKCYGKDIEIICCMICGINTSWMEALLRMPTITPSYSSGPN